MSKINSADVKEFFISGGKFAIELVRESYGDIINQEGEEAFSNAIEIGIGNTIASLYDANIDDDEIIRILNKFWGINIDEAESRILHEKSQATIRELRSYLKMEGYNFQEINHFMISNKAGTIIRHNNELWKLKDKPEKLIKKLKESKWLD